MILDCKKNLQLYRGISKPLSRALAYLQNEATEDIGNFVVDSDNIYGFCKEFNLQPHQSMSYESHKKYIDIHYVVQGCEKIYYANINSLNLTTSYNPDNDAALYKSSDNGNMVVLNKGDFAVFFPDDAHKPYCQTNECSQVRKIVMKVIY